MPVYRFRVKGSGSAGAVKFTDGMNVEVVDNGSLKISDPFNTRVEKIFVQEFANKYNLKQDFSTISAIKSLFKRNKLDVEVI